MILACLACSAWQVRPFQTLPHPCDILLKAFAEETENVFEGEDQRFGFSDNSNGLWPHVARVVRPQRLSANTEWLTWWTARDNVNSLERRPGNFSDVRLLVGPVSDILSASLGVMRDRFGSIAIALYEHEMMEARARKAESEATAAAENLDAGRPIVRRHLHDQNAG